MRQTFEKLQNYCMKTNHPCIQYFYFVIGPFFYTACSLLILHPKIGVIGDKCLYLCHIIAAIGFYNYILAWKTNPGTINSQNEKEYNDKYKQFYDQYAFKANTKCTTCEIIK